MTHVQRFGSSINLNVHFHVMVLDGVFTRDELGRPVFHRAPSPTRAELEQVVRRVVPKRPEAKRCEPQPATPKKEPARRSNDARASRATAASKQPTAARATCAPTPGAKSVATPPTALDRARSAGAPATANAMLLAPNILTTKHWSRLLGGSLYAASPRVDWATLLRRSFEVDVLRCAACGSRLRVLGELTEPPLVAVVLESLGLPTDAPRVAPARDPTELPAAETD